MPLTETKLADLPTPLRRTYDRAVEAAEKANYDYAFEMLRGLLRKVPGCLEIRNVLRKAQMDRVKDKPTWLVQAQAWPVVLLGAYVTGPILLKKDKTVEALDLGEKLMIRDPRLLPSILFLATAAEKAGLVRLALQVLEHARQNHEKNMEVLRRQLAVYQRAGDDQKALETLQAMCALAPNDLELGNQMKQASASAAMQRGNWNQAESFRDVVKDKDEAQELEDKRRVAIRDDDTLQRQITSTQNAVEQEPTVANLRRLADLYRQDGQYDKALEQYNRIVETSGSMDPAIDQAITDTLAAQYDETIAEWEKTADQNAARRPEAEREIARLRKERSDALFERIEERVKRYPNDAQYRFEYGIALFDRERIDEALKQFQSAQRNPRYRRRSHLYIARCMTARGMTELAIEQLESALAESAEMNADRKEILYHLALNHEARGETDASLKYLKEIYAADVNYEDVEQRIQKHYAGRG